MHWSQSAEKEAIADEKPFAACGNRTRIVCSVLLDYADIFVWYQADAGQQYVLFLYSRLDLWYLFDDVVSTTVDGEEYFLRVVAQGGDIVEFSDDGFLIINGQTQYEEIMSESLVPEDSTLTYPYQVPYGSYFLLGDARTDCIDSRVFGARTAKEINGKVIGIFRHRQF